jgi:hypothetical protein
LQALIPEKRTINRGGETAPKTIRQERKRMLNDDPVSFQPLLDGIKQLQDLGLPKPVNPGRLIEKAARYGGAYPIPNLAVTLCEKSFETALTKAKEEGRSNSEIRVIGKIAYCHAMPRPSGASNIRDFIACVLYGMSVDIISGPEGTRLLYGAQVAHTALTKRPKSAVNRPIQTLPPPRQPKQNKQHKPQLVCRKAGVPRGYVAHFMAFEPKVAAQPRTGAAA